MKTNREVWGRWEGILACAPEKCERILPGKRFFFINTPLQWGENLRNVFPNRFNGFRAARKTVETVPCIIGTSGTSLKRGVNQRLWKIPHPRKFPL
jgi:hypothetical protein